MYRRSLQALDRSSGLQASAVHIPPTQQYLCGCRGCFYVAFTAPQPARIRFAAPPIVPGAHCGRLSPCSGTSVPPVFALAGDRGVPPFWTFVADVAGVAGVVSSPLIEAKHDERASLLSIPPTQCARLMTSPVRAAKGRASRQTANNPPVAKGCAPNRKVLRSEELPVCVRYLCGQIIGLALALACSLWQPNPAQAVCCGALPLAALYTGAPFRDRALTIRLPDKNTFAGVASVSRPFAPRPTRCAVCSSSVARCDVCHRRRPYKRVRATFDVAHIAGRKITFVESLGRSLLASGGNPSNPACAPSPIAARNLLRFPTRPPLAG